jgi:Copper type II ascorbate-dependent monooxygenase, C-terminal domain
MPTRPLFFVVTTLSIFFGLAACSSSSSAPAPSSKGPADDGYSLLAEGDWTLDPGTEEPDHCIKVPIKEDIYLSAIRPIAPLGTHHTFVALSDTADGPRCVSAVATGTLIYAAGLGSQGIVLPDGVAMKLPAGKVLNLSLHIYNPTTKVLTGRSGMEIKKIDPADVKYESQTTLAGPIGFTVPPGRSVLTHECEIEEEQTAFVLFPHMHQLGRHLKTTITIGGVETVLHDDDFSFGDQPQIPIDPVTFAVGDRVRTECTYENDTGNTVNFGESSDTEMCFSVLFRYPQTSTSWCKTITQTTAAQ